MEKIFTLSFDDNVTQDKRFIELLKKYNLTCTFNLNSGLCGLNEEIVRCGKNVAHNKNKAEEIPAVYSGFEIAAHTMTHPMLTELSAKEIIKQVVGDRIRLSDIIGYDVRGMAYPGGAPNYDRLVVDLLEKYTDICYARTIDCTYNFDFPENYLIWNPTAHILDDCVENLIDKFANEEKACLLYLWGHTYEFDLHNAWERAEKILARLSRIKDATCMTNMQVYEKFHKR